VIRWHRRGFRAYWRWKYRRCGGRSRIDREIRDLIRRMSEKNPLWGAPGIHGELLMLAIEVTQSTVARYMTRRRGHPRGLEDVPPQSCRRDRVHRSVRGSLHLLQTALGSGDRSRMPFLGTKRRDLIRDRDGAFGPGYTRPYSCHGNLCDGNPGSPYRTALAVAERPRRTAHRIDTSRISRSPHRVRRRALARWP